MDYFFRSYLFLTTLMVVISIGIIRYKALDIQGKVLLAYLVVAWIVETAAFYAGVQYNNNIIVYKIGGIAQLFLVALYFNFAIDIFRKWRIGILIGIGVIVMGVISNFYHQPGNRLSHNFITFQSFLVFVMALMSLANVINAYGYKKMRKRPELWGSLVFLIYFTMSYFVFTLLNYFYDSPPLVVQQLRNLIFLINCMGNAAFGIIFFRYHKLNRNEGA